jgi:iron complex transport system permease protein
VTPARAAIVITALLLGSIAFALVAGPGDVDIATAVGVLADHLGGGAPSSPIADALVWDVRLPRALLAAIVGAALASAGALTQGLFRNPLADPSVLGVALGAALFAVAGFALGLDRHAVWVTPLLAAAGALVTLAALYGVALARPSTASLLLAGVAIGALCGALTSLVLAWSSDRFDLGIKVMRWLMGSFEARSWDHLAGAVVPIVLGLVGAMALQRDLDALALGDDTAASLGVALGRIRGIAMLVVAVLVGAATAVAGVLGFLGLVVPHVVRMLVGGSHRRVVPLSALLGALVLLAVDTGTRASSTVLPPGVVTNLVGAPFFLWLLLHRDPGAEA